MISAKWNIKLSSNIYDLLKKYVLYDWILILICILTVTQWNVAVFPSYIRICCITPRPVNCAPFLYTWAFEVMAEIAKTTVMTTMAMWLRNRRTYTLIVSIILFDKQYNYTFLQYLWYIHTLNIVRAEWSMAMQC